MAERQPERFRCVTSGHERADPAEALSGQHGARTVCPPPLRVFGADRRQQLVGDILYQLAAPAEYRSSLVFIDIVDAKYSHRHDASVVYGGVNCRAYAKVIEPGFTIGQYHQAEGLRNINVRQIEPNPARFPGESARRGKQLPAG